MLALMALSGQVGYISLEATLEIYSINGRVTFSASEFGGPRWTVMVSGIKGIFAFIFSPQLRDDWG